MRNMTIAMIAAIAGLHGYIAWFEVFAWETHGPAIFTSLPETLFSQTVPMAV
jgi:putative membrane protein